jgi:hypothetical protein
MAKNAQKIISNIKSAFRDVQLEDGIGLFEAQGIDDYKPREQQLKLRLKDEKEDWLKISAADLRNAMSSLPFFDAKGVRFHLPRFLIYDIKTNDQNTLFHLTNELETDHKKEIFSLLNSTQVTCIIEYLDYLKDQIKVEYENVLAIRYGTDPKSYREDADYISIEEASHNWKKKLNQ